MAAFENLEKIKTIDIRYCEAYFTGKMPSNSRAIEIIRGFPSHRQEIAGEEHEADAVDLINYLNRRHEKAMRRFDNSALRLFPTVLSWVERNYYDEYMGGY